MAVGSGLRSYPDLCLCWDAAICHFPVEVCLEQLPSATSVDLAAHEAPYKPTYIKYGDAS